MIRFILTFVLGVLAGCSRGSDIGESDKDRAQHPRPMSSARTIDVEVLQLFKPSHVIVRGAQSVRAFGGFFEDVQKPRSELRVADGGLFLDGMFIKDGVRIEALDGTLAVSVRSGKRSIADDNHIERSYQGTVKIHSLSGVLRIIVTMDFEDYVAGVLAAELPSGSRESRRAQAIVIRTYALNHRGRHALSDVCDLTHCQVYKDRARSEDLEIARSTHGMVLLSEGALARSFYSSTCGGHTANRDEVWPGGAAHEDATAVSDARDDGRAWCEASPHFRWQVDMTRDELFGVLKSSFPSLRPDFHMNVTHAKSGWIKAVEISGVSRFLTGEDFHLLLGRALGWNIMKSAHFEMVEFEDGSLRFIGRGLGHGVGLCQYGAMAQAKAGRSASDILRHYFPNFEVGLWD